MLSISLKSMSELTRSSVVVMRETQTVYGNNISLLSVEILVVMPFDLVSSLLTWTELGGKSLLKEQKNLKLYMLTLISYS